jgi:hypothetical protein
MAEIYIYIFIAIVTVVTLNSNIAFGGNRQVGFGAENQRIIEHLTQHSSKSKNYRKTPKGYRSHGYAVTGEISGDLAYLDYKFPLIDSAESHFKIKLNKHNVSSIVSEFGCKADCYRPKDEHNYEFATNDEVYLKDNMNKDGFFFESFEEGKYGIDYNHTINISSELSIQIASFIKNELVKKGKDTYENRVRGALNFVQFIPYGIPDFDNEQDCYFGLALPHESLAISYSDCDSKSTLFASILRHLINPENIILVGCLIEEGAHMIAGVTGFNFPGQYYHYMGKDFLLIETTSPIPLELQPSNRFQQIEIIPLKRT